MCFSGCKVNMIIALTHTNVKHISRFYKIYLINKQHIKQIKK